MPATQWRHKMSHAFARRSIESSRHAATSGKNGLSSRLPDAQAKVRAMSSPKTSIAAWLAASGMTGFTLPAMIVDPGWRCGRNISAGPPSGPPAMNRRSPHTLSRVVAQALIIPETSTKTSAFCVLSTRFSARANPMPVTSRKTSVTRKMYSRGAASPVPIAVPPRLITLRRSSHLYMRHLSRLNASA